jgi:hypothetical protein
MANGTVRRDYTAFHGARADIASIERQIISRTKLLSSAGPVSTSIRFSPARP